MRGGGLLPRRLARRTLHPEYRQSSTGNVAVAATCATMPLFLSKGKTNKSLLVTATEETEAWWMLYGGVVAGGCLASPDPFLRCQKRPVRTCMTMVIHRWRWLFTGFRHKGADAKRPLCPCGGAEFLLTCPSSQFDHVKLVLLLLTMCDPRHVAVCLL